MGKVFLNYEQQLKKLQEDKKLNILNLNYAHEMLKRYSYYSLINGYKEQFKNPDTTNYREGVCFEDIVALYEFDENIRGLFLKYLQKIERQMKSHISFYFCQKYGNVPLWVLINALTFGNVSKFYMLCRYDIQAKIAMNYEGINESQLSKILIVLTGFRNVCAHGERLYCYHTKQAIPNLTLHKKLCIPKYGQEYSCGKHDLFAVVLSMRYLLPGDWFLVFKKELIKILTQYKKKTSCFTEEEIFKFMGFPKNWKSITRYRKI